MTGPSGTEGVVEGLSVSGHTGPGDGCLSGDSAWWSGCDSGMGGGTA